MTIEMLGDRLAQLEDRVQEMEGRLPSLPEGGVQTGKREGKTGWRWFVGIYADSPDFDEVERVGKDWRNADQPYDAEPSV